MQGVGGHNLLQVVVGKYNQGAIKSFMWVQIKLPVGAGEQTKVLTSTTRESSSSTKHRLKLVVSVCATELICVQVGSWRS